MKKWMTALVTILILSVAFIYIFIPGKLTVSRHALVYCPASATSRWLLDESKWVNWWPPEGSQRTPREFLYDGYTYSISKKAFDALELLIQNKKIKTTSTLNIFRISKDSAEINWQAIIQTSANPFERIQTWQQAKRLENDMREILRQLQTFLEKEENVYQLTVRRTKVKDSVLISTKRITSSYPSVSILYGLVENLRAHIASNRAKDTNYPMLHVERLDSNRYETMVAIPVDRILPEKENIVIKRMVLGNILEAEIKGGPHTIQRAIIELENYKNDHQFISPAMPFESMVTDRSKQPDTGKWITRLYYPIF